MKTKPVQVKFNVCDDCAKKRFLTALCPGCVAARNAADHLNTMLEAVHRFRNAETHISPEVQPIVTAYDRLVIADQQLMKTAKSKPNPRKKR